MSPLTLLVSATKRAGGFVVNIIFEVKKAGNKPAFYGYDSLIICGHAALLARFHSL
jgi:hypothetical protein